MRGDDYTQTLELIAQGKFIVHHEGFRVTLTIVQYEVSISNSIQVCKFPDCQCNNLTCLLVRSKYYLTRHAKFPFTSRLLENGQQLDVISIYSRATFHQGRCVLGPLL